MDALAAEVEAISMYEDALDEEADDLGKLCEDARKQIRRHESRRLRGQPTLPLPSTSSPSPSTVNPQKRSSSSEHSSIEKLAGGTSAFRSRRGTLSSQYRRSRSALSSSSTGLVLSSRTKQKSGSSQSNDASPQEEFRLVNYAFHDVSSYGIMLQLSQQLQMVSRQLYEMESTNAMQLKIITRMLQMLLESRKRTPWYSPSRWLRPLSLFPLLIVWPLVARFFWGWWTRRRQQLAMRMIRNL